MKRLILASLAAAALAVTASAATAATHNSCPSLGGQFLHIRVTNTSCQVAKDDVIFYTAQGVKPPGWACTPTAVTTSRSKWTCKHRGGKVVAYSDHV